jgi:hypothetical protein
MSRHVVGSFQDTATVFRSTPISTDWTPGSPINVCRTSAAQFWQHMLGILNDLRDSILPAPQPVGAAKHVPKVG